MERPSHIIFDTQAHYFSHRLPWISLAISLQIAALWLFMHGFSNYRMTPTIGDIVVAPIPKEDSKGPVKPPEPVLIKPKPVTAEKPIFDYGRGPVDNSGIHADPEQRPVTVATNPVVPDRGAVSITATHTLPPYPPIARRIGAEGKVTLRLTVLPDGRVGKAEVLNSSGRADLDETAQQWIVAHWTYRPASHDGQPIIGQATATVVFSLTN